MLNKTEKIWFTIFNIAMVLFLFVFYLLWLEPVYRGFMASLSIGAEVCMGVVLSLILAIFSTLVFDYVALKLIKLIEGEPKNNKIDEKDTEAFFKD